MTSVTCVSKVSRTTVPCKEYSVRIAGYRLQQQRFNAQTVTHDTIMPNNRHTNLWIS